MAEVPDHYWDLLLSDDEGVSLLARHDIALHYTYLVEGCARKLESKLPHYVDDADLVSTGWLGMMRAIDRYDPEVGPFSRFASTLIYGAVLDELRRLDWASRSLRQKQRHISKARVKLAGEGHDVSLRMIAEHLGWEQAKVEATIREVRRASVMALNSDTLNGDTLESSTLVEEDVANSNIGLVCSLFARDYQALAGPVQVVLARIYLLNQTLTEVSRSMGLPLAVVRHLHIDGVRAAMASARGSLVG